MKPPPRPLLVALALLASMPLGQATNPAMGLIPHPVYLGTHADPAAIPLSAVPVWHNYGFGVHEVITKPRAFPGGPLVSEKAIEFNVNLASVYDIQVLPEEPTLVPQVPILIKVGSRALPAEARHSREQALEATLWSLLLTTPGDEETPLVVKIESANPEHANYAGNYVLAPDRLTLAVGNIPGSELVRDARGVVSAVFKNVEKPTSTTADSATPRVAFVPLIRGGGAEGDETIALVPHWTDNHPETAPLELLFTAIPLGMNVLSSMQGANANPLHNGPFDTQNLTSATRKVFLYSSSNDVPDSQPELDRKFATLCFGAVLTSHPSEKEPLVIAFDGHPPEAWLHLGADGWTVDPQSPQSTRWTRSFAATPGSILGYRITPRLSGGWWLEPAEPPLPVIREVERK
jgi:hypothetical protein